MSVRSAQSITVEFTTASFSTGAAADADSTPTGTLVVNGTDNAASVTVTKVDTGRYKAAVTLPTLSVGDVVELYISATVGGVAGKAIVWRDTKDVLLDSSGKTTDAVQTGDSYAIVNSGTYGNAQLVRSTTPGNTLTVNASNQVTVPDTQKVDLNTIKTNPVVNAGTITFPTGATLASTTNITAGTITTATNLTNAPTSGDFTSTMKTSLNAATPASVTGDVGGKVLGGGSGTITAAGAWVLDSSGNSVAPASTALSTAQWTNTRAGYLDNLSGGAVMLASSYTAPLSAAGTRSAVGLASANLDTQLAGLDADIVSRLATSSYTAPDNSGIAAIKAKTDNLPADPAGLAGLASAHGAGSWATATGFSTHSAADVWGVATRTLTAFSFSVTTNALAAGTITASAIADGAITDAKITMPAEAAGRPTTALGILRRAWEWLTNKRTRDRTTGTVTLYGADNTTALETQTQATASSVDSISKGA